MQDLQGIHYELQPHLARKRCAGSDPAKNCVAQPDAVVPELAGIGIK